MALVTQMPIDHLECLITIVTDPENEKSPIWGRAIKKNRLNEFITDGQNSRLGTIADSQLVEDIDHVAFYGVWAYGEHV